MQKSTPEARLTSLMDSFEKSSRVTWRALAPGALGGPLARLCAASGHPTGGAFRSAVAELTYGAMVILAGIEANGISWKTMPKRPFELQGSSTLDFAKMIIGLSGAVGASGEMPTAENAKDVVLRGVEILRTLGLGDSEIMDEIEKNR